MLACTSGMGQGEIAFPVTYVSQPRASDSSRISLCAPPPATTATRPALWPPRAAMTTGISGPRKACKPLGDLFDRAVHLPDNGRTARNLRGDREVLLSVLDPDGAGDQPGR